MNGKSRTPCLRTLFRNVRQSTVEFETASEHIQCQFSWPKRGITITVSGLVSRSLNRVLELRPSVSAATDYCFGSMRKSGRSDERPTYSKVEPHIPMHVARRTAIKASGKYSPFERCIDPTATLSGPFRKCCSLPNSRWKVEIAEAACSRCTPPRRDGCTDMPTQHAATIQLAGPCSGMLEVL